MGGDQETHIGDCSLIYLDQDKDGFYKDISYTKYGSTFPLNRPFEFCLLPRASSRHVYVTSEARSRVFC